MTERSCRVCGCTQERACIDPKKARSIHGVGCHWVAKDLCNVCDDAAAAIKVSLVMRESLITLRRCRAKNRETMVFVDGGLHHVQALRNRGLIDSEYVAARRRTAYWITPIGDEVLRRGAGR
jgi:hypothetical protein